MLNNQSRYNIQLWAMFPQVFKVSVRIKCLLCNILPELISIWNDTYEICAKTFLEGTFMCA